MKCFCFINWLLLSYLWVDGQELRLQRTLIPLIDGSYSNNMMLLAGGLSNPSALTNQKNFAASLATEQTFLLKDARLFSAMFIQPFRRTLAGMLVTHSGSAGATQSSVSLLFGKSLGKVQLGTEFLFHHSGIAGSVNRVTLDAGMFCRIQLSQSFNAGFRLRNMAGLFFKNESSLASIIQAGAGYDVSKTVHLGFECLQEPARSPGIITGLLYRFHRLFIVIFGMGWSPCQPYGGFQLEQRNWKFFLKTSFHPELGWSPTVGISFGKIAYEEK